MSRSATYRVLRLPGAPPRRAGHAWPAGVPVTCDLSAGEAAELSGDPGYRVEPVAPVAVPAPRRPSKTKT